MVVQAGLTLVRGLARAGPKVLVPTGAAVLAGVAAGAKGTIDTVRARSVRKAVARRYDDAVAVCESERIVALAFAHEYGDFQVRAHQGTVGRFAD